MLLPAIAFGSMCGFVAVRWARSYQCLLLAGAPPDARTLWGALFNVGKISSVSPEASPRALLRDSFMALLSGLLAAWLLQAGHPYGPGLVLLCMVMLCLAWIDLQTGLLPDALTLPLMLAGWVAGPLAVTQALLASASVFLLLAAAAHMYRRLRGHDGFGAGDIKCLAALAAWVGVVHALAILWLACVLGILWWVGVSRMRRQSYPFGPCLALAAICLQLAEPALKLRLL